MFNINLDLYCQHAHAPYVYRHWIVLFVLIVAALFLAFAIVAFVLLIFCKWTKFFTM